MSEEKKQVEITPWEVLEMIQQKIIELSNRKIITPGQEQEQRSIGIPMDMLLFCLFDLREHVAKLEYNMGAILNAIERGRKQFEGKESNSPKE